MPWTRNGRKLWDFIKYHNPIILTQCRMEDHAELYTQFRAWIDRELGTDIRLYCVTDDVHKDIVCQEHDILIDDSGKYRTGWEMKGGKFVHHRNDGAVDDTIRALA